MSDNLTEDEKTLIMARIQMIKALGYGAVTVKITNGRIIDVEAMSREKHETIKALYDPPKLRD